MQGPSRPGGLTPGPKAKLMEHNTVEHLQCVECTSFPLRLVADSGGGEGILVCTQCAQCYAVRDGIPSMVLPELRSDEELRIINEWLDRLSPDDRARAHARAERPGTGSAKVGRSVDKLREMDLRDRESRGMTICIPIGSSKQNWRSTTG